MKKKIVIILTFLMVLVLVGCSSFNSFKELKDDEIVIAGYDGITTVYENKYLNDYNSNNSTYQIDTVSLNLAVTTSKNTMERFNETKLYDEIIEDGVTKYYFLEFTSIKKLNNFVTYKSETIDITKIEYNISEKLVKSTNTHKVNNIFEEYNFEYIYKNEIMDYDSQTTIDIILSDEYIETNFSNIYKQLLEIKDYNNENGIITILHGLHYINLRTVKFSFTDHMKIKNKEEIGW